MTDKTTTTTTSKTKVELDIVIIQPIVSSYEAFKVKALSCPEDVVKVKTFLGGLPSLTESCSFKFKKFEFNVGDYIIRSGSTIIGITNEEGLKNKYTVLTKK